MANAVKEFLKIDVLQLADRLADSFAERAGIHLTPPAADLLAERLRITPPALHGALMTMYAASAAGKTAAAARGQAGVCLDEAAALKHLADRERGAKVEIKRIVTETAGRCNTYVPAPAPAAGDDTLRAARAMTAARLCSSPSWIVHADGEAIGPCAAGGSTIDVWPRALLVPA